MWSIYAKQITQIINKKVTSHGSNKVLFLTMKKKERNKRKYTHTHTHRPLNRGTGIEILVLTDGKYHESINNSKI